MNQIVDITTIAEYINSEEFKSLDKKQQNAYLSNIDPLWVEDEADEIPSKFDNLNLKRNNMNNRDSIIQQNNGPGK